MVSYISLHSLVAVETRRRDVKASIINLSEDDGKVLSAPFIVLVTGINIVYGSTFLFFFFFFRGKPSGFQFLEQHHPTELAR